MAGGLRRHPRAFAVDPRRGGEAHPQGPSTENPDVFTDETRWSYCLQPLTSALARRFVLQRKLGSDQTMLARLSGLEAQIAEALRLAEEAAHRDNVPEMVQVYTCMHSYIHIHILCPKLRLIQLARHSSYMGFKHVLSHSLVCILNYAYVLDLCNRSSLPRRAWTAPH